MLVVYRREGKYVLLNIDGHERGIIAIGNDDAHAQECLEVLQDMQARKAACKCDHAGCCGKYDPS